MKKRILMVSAVIFALNVLVISDIQAASNRCTVTKTDGDVLIMKCERDLSRFKPGSKVKIKTARSGAAVEGC